MSHVRNDSPMITAFNFHTGQSKKYHSYSVGGGLMDQYKMCSKLLTIIFVITTTIWIISNIFMNDMN